MDEKRLYLLNQCAAEYFHDLLFKSIGKEALAYMTNERRFSKRILDRHAVGYAPADWEKTVCYLKNKGFSDEELLAADLARRNKNGELYSRFRDRIMIPIRDEYGRFIAFGGRLMSGEGSKYLNSTETPVFKKGEHLFLLNFAKKTKPKTLILCEGYMDAMALNSIGFHNAVATLGTALTEEQIVLMKGFADAVLLCFDGDEAGQIATDKAIERLAPSGLEVKVLRLTGAKDPDEIIKQYGADALKKQIANPTDVFDYSMRRAQIRNDINTQDGALDALNQSVDLICKKFILSSIS